jgi:hypothetical protein
MTTTASTPPATTAAPPRRTAADELARYFAQARRADARIHAAATAINGDIGAAGPLQFSEATKNAVKAADPWRAASDIPAGLKPDLMWAVLRVQNDLESRWYAFRPVVYGSASSPGEARHDLLRCFGGGAPAAARFGSDLAAARSLAAASPPVTRVLPASRRAADLAIRLQLIVLANGGCDSCGGYLFGHLPPVRWYTSHVAGITFDGTAGAIPFTARYHAASGWEIRLNAC